MPNTLINLTKRGSDIILVGESHGVSEAFQDLEKVLRPISEQINVISQSGLDVSGKNYKVHMMFFGEHNVYYAIMGMGSSRSKQLCPWCRTHLEELEMIPTNIHEADLLPRPPILNRFDLQDQLFLVHKGVVRGLFDLSARKKLTAMSAHVRFRRAVSNQHYNSCETVTEISASYDYVY